MNENKQWPGSKLFDFNKKWRAHTIPVNVQIDYKEVALDLSLKESLDTNETPTTNK